MSDQPQEKLSEHLTIQLKPSQLAKVRATAKAADRTMGWIVRQLIDQVLDPDSPNSTG